MDKSQTFLLAVLCGIALALAPQTAHAEPLAAKQHPSNTSVWTYTHPLCDSIVDPVNLIFEYRSVGRVQADAFWFGYVPVSLTGVGGNQMFRFGNSSGATCKNREREVFLQRARLTQDHIRLVGESAEGAPDYVIGSAHYERVRYCPPCVVVIVGGRPVTVCKVWHVTSQFNSASSTAARKLDDWYSYRIERWPNAGPRPQCDGSLATNTLGLVRILTPR